MIRLAMALLFLFLCSALAEAADVKIGEISLRLPAFPGHCEMDPVVAADARLIAHLHGSLAKAGKRLLVLSADCAELRDWRDGTRPVLDHMAQYQTVIALENGALPDTSEVLVKRFCDEMNAAADQSLPGTAQDVQGRAEVAAKIVRTNEVKYLGVVASEPLVCYSATMHKFAVENAGEFIQATLITATILRNKIVVCYLFAPYSGRETILKLLAAQQANVRRLQRENRT